MNRIQVVFASRHGGTAGIAIRIAEVLRTEGLEVDVHDAADRPDASGFDAHLIGSGVYMGRWLKEGIEFLERNRAGMSSTFLTRLRVGELLVDARGVSRLVSRQVGVWPLIAFTAAGLGAIVAAILVSPELRELIDILGTRLLELLGLR